MIHDELIEKLEDYAVGLSNGMVNAQMVFNVAKAIRTVVAYHSPVKHEEGTWCSGCSATEWYPCPTVQFITKALNG